MKTREVDPTKSVEPGFIRLISKGKTVAYVLMASHYDEEDIGYMTDPEFWKMIRQRRKEQEGIPLDQAMAALESRERRQSGSASKKARITSKAKKR